VHVEKVFLRIFALTLAHSFTHSFIYFLFTVFHPFSLGDITTAKALLSQRCDVNSQDDKGITALMHAAFKGHSQIVLLLIEACCNIEARDNDGWTALLHATRRGRTSVVEVLINVGNCNVDAQDNKGSLRFD